MIDSAFLPPSSRITSRTETLRSDYLVLRRRNVELPLPPSPSLFLLFSSPLFCLSFGPARLDGPRAMVVKSGPAGPADRFFTWHTSSRGTMLFFFFLSCYLATHAPTFPPPWVGGPPPPFFSSFTLFATKGPRRKGAVSPRTTEIHSGRAVYRVIDLSPPPFPFLSLFFFPVRRVVREDKRKMCQAASHSP